MSPPHVDFEVGAALVRAERREVVPAGQAVELVRAFSTVPVERHWHPSDPVEALALVNTTTYADAWYLAMAARLGCAVMTLGASMAAAAAMHGIPIADRTGLPS